MYQEIDYCTGPDSMKGIKPKSFQGNYQQIEYLRGLSMQVELDRIQGRRLVLLLLYRQVM